MSKTGSCLCGAVRYTITSAPKTTTACHCAMCRKWSGGVFLAYSVPAEDVQFDGEGIIATYPSSDWAERGFCKTCGSSLFYRLTTPGPHQGNYEMSLGTLDDANGVALSDEIFIESKPDGYSFAQDTRKMTGAEVFAMYAPE